MVAVLVVSALFAIPAAPAHGASDSRRTPPLIDCGIAGPQRPGDPVCQSLHVDLYRVRDCFAKDVVRRPDLGCRVEVLFSIAPSGRTEASLVLPAEPCPANAVAEPARPLSVMTPVESAVLGNESVESCIAEVTASWRLPPSSEHFFASYLFVIRAGNGGDRSPPFEIAPVTDGRDGMGRIRDVPLPSSDGRRHEVKARRLPP